MIKLRGTNSDLDRFRPSAAALEKTWVTSVRESRTDTQGRFHFADLPGGELRVTATVRGRPDSKAEHTVQLPEGGRVAGLELTLDPGIPITGFVRTPEGDPAPGVFVQVAGSADQPRIRATSGSGGRFELLGVTAEMDPVQLFTIVGSYNWYHPDAPLGASRRTTAHPGDTGLVLELRRLVSMSGRVETAEGEPASRHQIQAYLSGSAQVPASVLARATTDSSGAFEIALPTECLVDLVAKPPKTAGTSPTTMESVSSGSQDIVLRLR